MREAQLTTLPRWYEQAEVANPTIKLITQAPVCGYRGIRTPELVRDWIYSPAPLTTRPPTQVMVSWKELKPSNTLDQLSPTLP